MVPYSRYRRIRNSTSNITIYDSTESSTSAGDYDYFYSDEYVSLSGNTGVNDGESTGGISGCAGLPPIQFNKNKNKISNINFKLKQRILPVKQQMRFTTRNAL